jgi:hypothetical protein
VAIARGSDKEALSRNLGAHHFIDSATEDVAARLNRLGGARAVLATVTSDQPVFRFDEIENAGNAEFGSKLLRLHRSSLSREIIIADCGAAAPSRNSADRGAEDSFGSSCDQSYHSALVRSRVDSRHPAGRPSVLLGLRHALAGILKALHLTGSHAQLWPDTPQDYRE